MDEDREQELLLHVAAGTDPLTAFAADHFFYPNTLGANLDWLRFIASIGAVLLTFLAGAEQEQAAVIYRPEAWTTARA